MNLIVGDIVKLQVPCLGNDPGTLGVVYEVYPDSERIPNCYGASIIFENGFYDGFSVMDQSLFLEKVGHEPTLENYQFISVNMLTSDFRNRVFNKVLKNRNGTIN